MKESKYKSYDDLPLFLNAKWGPCGNAKRFRGERRNSGMSEPRRLRRGEGYEARSDDKQDKGAPPQAAPLQSLLPAVRAVCGRLKVTSFQRGK